MTGRFACAMMVLFIAISGVSANASAAEIITVATRGKADYHSVQAAIDAAPARSRRPVIIEIAVGT